MAACSAHVSERFKWRVGGRTQWEKGGGDRGDDGGERGGGGGRFISLVGAWEGCLLAAATPDPVVISSVKSLDISSGKFFDISSGKFSVKFSVNFSQNPVHHPLALTFPHSLAEHQSAGPAGHDTPATHDMVGHGVGVVPARIHTHTHTHTHIDTHIYTPQEKKPTFPVQSPL